jgi:exodeoxyribonuclease VII small subunit
MEQAMAKKTKDELPAEQMSFEQALADLEQIVAAMEQGEVPLAESIAQYERGVQMIQRCRGLLEQAEKKIELLAEKDNGKPTTQPLDEPADDEQE